MMRISQNKHISKTTLPEAMTTFGESPHLVYHFRAPLISMRKIMSTQEETGISKPRAQVSTRSMMTAWAQYTMRLACISITLHPSVLLAHPSDGRASITSPTSTTLSIMPGRAKTESQLESRKTAESSIRQLTPLVPHMMTAMWTSAMVSWSQANTPTSPPSITHISWVASDLEVPQGTSDKSARSTQDLVVISPQFKLKEA